MKFRVFSTFLLAAAALLGGCGKSEDKAAGKPPAEKPKIALVMKSLANEFFSTMAAGASRHQKTNAAAYDLLANGIKNETDLAEQVNLVEQMIALQVNAIVIAPADSKALATVLKHAKEAGILVVNIDNKLDAGVLKQADLQVPFVGPDNRAGARKVGEVLAKQLKIGDNVAIIEGIPTAFNGQQRRLGFEDAMKAAGVNIVSVQSGDWEMEKANGVATALLSEHPDLKAILCANDNMALGAVAAIEAGLNRCSLTARSAPGPRTVIAAVTSSPLGALAQSTSAQSRTSSFSRPENWLRRTHAASAAALQLKGVVPVLKMPMKCFCRVKASKVGRVSDATWPSTATPQPAPATGVTAAVTGRSNTARLRGFEDIM